MLLGIFYYNASAKTLLLKEDNDSTASFKERIALRTNMIDWILVTPNVGVEYDIVNNPFHKISLGLSSRYNWDSQQKLIPRYVYNIFEAKGELRFYWRDRKRLDWENEWKEEENTFWGEVKARWHLLKAKKKPRANRAYYMGPFVAYDKYSLKFTDTGYQGYGICAGLSFGFNTPLYLYKNGDAIDFELGAGVGFMATQYDKYRWDEESNCYPFEKSEKMHILPFPVINNINLSLVYRFNSIKNQIVATNVETIKDREYLYRFRKEYENVAVNYQNDEKAISRYNNEIVLKNKEIKEYKEKVEIPNHIDSAYCVEYLHPMLPYATPPDKITSFGTNRRLSPKEVQTVQELGVKPLNKLIEQYPQVSGDIESNILQVYRLLCEQGDGKQPIWEYELILTSYNRINDFCIKPYNERYCLRTKQGGTTAPDINTGGIFTDPATGDTLVNYHFLVPTNEPIFLKEQYNSLYTVKDHSGETVSITENDRIETENNFKRNHVLAMPGIQYTGKGMSTKESKKKRSKEEVKP